MKWEREKDKTLVSIRLAILDNRAASRSTQIIHPCSFPRFCIHLPHLFSSVYRLTSMLSSSLLFLFHILVSSGFIHFHTLLQILKAQIHISLYYVPNCFSVPVIFPFLILLPHHSAISGQISSMLTFLERHWTQLVPADLPNTYRAIQTPIIGKQWPLSAHKQRLIKRATPQKKPLTAQTYGSHTVKPSDCLYNRPTSTWTQTIP